MGYNITAGYPLSNNDSAVGISSIWINETGIVSNTKSATNEITAFVADDATNNEWFEFECAFGEGQLVRAGSSGSGGKEYVSTLTYKIGGLSQAKIDAINEIVESSRLAICIEQSDGKLVYVSSRGMTASTTNFDTGVAGAGGTAIGDTITFTSQDSSDLSIVDLGTNADLNAITT